MQEHVRLHAYDVFEQAGHQFALRAEMFFKEEYVNWEDWGPLYMAVAMFLYDAAGVS